MRTVGLRRVRVGSWWVTTWNAATHGCPAEGPSSKVGTLVAAGCGRKSGGAGGIRTPDLVIANDALSQLSYSPDFLDCLMFDRLGDAINLPRIIPRLANGTLDVSRDSNPGLILVLVFRRFVRMIWSTQIPGWISGKTLD